MTRTRLRATLLASTIVATMGFGGTAFAQDSGAPPAGDPVAAGVQTQESAGPADDSSTGDIVVTGTLIKNPNLISSSPVSVVGAAELQLRQTNTAEEVLRDLPGAVPSIGSAVNNGNGGAAFADLRGLGNFRNLVLLDGVRITPSSTVGRVDLNNIPLALVERVDTLTGGAATTYGADAVSGVINFITRSDFAGAEIAASEQLTQRGDGNFMRVDATIGANFDDGRGNAVLSIGYQEADPVYQGARRFSLNNYTSTTGGVGGSGTTVPGRFTLGSTFNQIRPNGSLATPVTNFNFNPYNIFQTPFKRYNIYGAGHYDIADNVEFYTRGMFSKNQVGTIIAPSGVFSSNALIPVSNPYLPAAARAQFCANNDFDPSTLGVQTLTVAQCNLAATATSASDPNFRAFTTQIGRRFTEAGPRLSDFVTQMFDYRAGLRIGLTNAISLDLSGSYGESENRQTLQGYILTSRVRTALYTTNANSCNLGPSPTVITPVNGLPSTLAAGGASPTAGSGCVPLNIFGADGSITPAMLSYLTAASTTRQQTSLAQARALVSGDFGASSPWANNPIGFAVGTEFRHNRAAQVADVLSQTAGELGGAGGAVPNFNGGYEVYEGYAEVIAPIVQDRPFFHNLTLEGGFRYSHYKVEAPGNPTYNTTTYKGAATWEPIAGLKVRGNYQRAVRAPNINELFAPSNVGLTNLTTDPCRTTRNAAGVITHAGPLTDANLAAVCRLQGAPASSIGTIPNPTAAQANATTAGGTYIRPEKADSYTIGAVFQPDFVPGLSITVDYYHIRIKNAISQPTPGDVINNCFGDANGSGITANSVNNPFCRFFRRNPVTGDLSGDPATVGGLVFALSNSGRILTDGIDVGFNYRRDIGFAKLNLSLNGNWTHRSQFQAIVPGSIIPPGYPGAGTVVPASTPRECVGLYSPNCGSPGSAGPNSAPGSLQPEFSWNARTTLSFDKVDVSLLWRHVSKMRAEPGFVTYSGVLPGKPGLPGILDGQTVDFGRIPAYNWFDLATRFDVSDNLDLTITVQNLLDKKPPLVGSTIGSASFNSGNTYPSTYDSLGRRFAVSARLKF